MTHRILCKYYMHGACLKGEYCEFSHDWNDQANNICTFYQKGACSYGSRCRYDHVKVQNAEHTPLIPSSSHPAGSVRSMCPTTSEVPMPTITDASSLYSGQLSHLSKPFLPPSENPWTVGPQQGLSFSGAALNAQTEPKSFFTDPSDKPICSFAAAGTCPRGDECPHIHGDLCATCQKHCLHPFRSEEREEHITQCQRNQKRLEALKLSQEIECSVCLEPVLSKSKPSERKFGLLLSCDHPFCITCIRNWRANTPTPGMDVNSILRSCPVCRKISHFIIPSVIWYSSPEEKEEIIANYKKKLSTIDCKYFDFGNGNCPFGTSCFYKHAYRDGRLEEVKLRHLGAADGSTMIAKNVRLSDFLEQLNI